MNTPAGGGGIVGLALTYLAARFGWDLPPDQAAVFGIGIGALAGASLHVLSAAYKGPGIWPAIRRTWRGPVDAGGGGA
jgi:hypothetical protein